MHKSAPARRGKFASRLGRSLMGIACFVAALAMLPASAQDTARRLESIDVIPLQGQGVELRFQLDGAAPDPMSFTIDDPARIALDLPNTTIALPERLRDVNVGPLTTIRAAEAGGRTRVVLNMTSLATYTTRVEGNSVFVTIGGQAGNSGVTFAGQPASSGAGAGAARGGPRAINMVDFSRSADGAGQVLVELSDPGTPVDVRREGGRIVVDFQDANLPSELLRRLDVTDYATPVVTVDALRSNDDSQLIVTVTEPYDYISYQADNLFTLEFRRPEAEEQVTGMFSEDKEYTGERLSLSFLDLPTRQVLQLLADTAELDMVVADTVQSSVTLRLNSVPWDQALDIILATKGLDMRRNGTVIWVAPAEEIAARESAELEARQALRELEPLRPEFIQVNNARAEDLAQLIRGSGTGNPFLSQRGSVTTDPRTNTLLLNDTTESLATIRRLVEILDVPVRQVLIESRIVVVNDDYSRNLGVRFGSTVVEPSGSDGLVSFSGNGAGSDAIIGSAINNLNNTGQPFPVSIPPINQRYNVNLPIGSPAGSLALAILDSDYLIDLELSAIQAEGNGRVISSPRVIAQNNFEANIAQGVEIPYQEAASSGATTTQFQEAKLSLTVTPQITPDDWIIMDLAVTKDSVGEIVPSATGGSVPSIDSREINSQVRVRDGETVVLGGIVETESRETYTKVPVLGDIPALGYLFRSRSNVNNDSELLIFVTPKILSEGNRIN